ncbi:hypothetical protein BD779DRAFT_1608737 [Infundibulicybe gibba]|nr:hypothetical protein BD779DRAFT_1608737 [Infundibulicybe gibba]
MDHTHSFQNNFGLHWAATAGDDGAVRRAIELGADVNACDSAGRTAIMCAVAGEDWQNIDASDASFMSASRLEAIRILLKHPDISLLTLNAPHASMNGVIPLGMAAWLNMVPAVRAVSIDGMDSHGATALMYAARDDGLEVVQLLLSYGARPDFRDCNHRTSIQFSLPHPRILWLCEGVLRHHRWRESQASNRTKLFAESDRLLELVSSSLPILDDFEPPPPSVFTDQAISRSTDTLVSSVTSNDLPFLHSLLFSPPLPPSSPPALYPMSSPVLPIHYCVAMEYPLVDVLDALYCAGADVALFTTQEHHTPSISSPNLRDLRSPLSAKDKNDETCIHIAAEHGSCIDMLLILLDCDSTGSVRELRNSRGLTALEVAKPEFRSAFGEDAERFRCVSSLSTRTIRPSESLVSLVSFSEWNSNATMSNYDEEFYSADFDCVSSSHEFLSNLRLSSPLLPHPSHPSHLDYLSGLMRESSQLGQAILGRYRTRIDDAAKDLEEARLVYDQIDNLLDVVVGGVEEKARNFGLDAFQPRRRNRDSEDSEATVVSRQQNMSTAQLSIQQSIVDENHRSVSTQTILTAVELKDKMASNARWPEWLENLIVNPDPAIYKSLLVTLNSVEHEISHYQTHRIESTADETDAKLKQLMKKRKKTQERIKELEASAEKKDSVVIGTKIKSWFKRKIAPERSLRLGIVLEIDENCAAGREVKALQTDEGLDDDESIETHVSDLSIHCALKTSHAVLEAARRDLLSIKQVLASADEFINSTNHSIARADRVAKRAVKKREALVTNLRATIIKANAGGSPGYLGYDNHIALRPSMASLSSVYSATSSLALTVSEHDDDDVRALRRLLLRKIEGGASSAWSEIDMVMGWLRIVKEVVRSVKRRTYV